MKCGKRNGIGFKPKGYALGGSPMLDTLSDEIRRPIAGAQGLTEAQRNQMIKVAQIGAEQDTARQERLAAGRMASEAAAAQQSQQAQQLGFQAQQEAQRGALAARIAGMKSSPTSGGGMQADPGAASAPTQSYSRADVRGVNEPILNKDGSLRNMGSSPSAVTTGEKKSTMGFRKGGAIAMVKGGEVKGPGGTDNVPAWLTKGEYVLPDEAVKKLGGIDALDSLVEKLTGTKPGGKDLKRPVTPFEGRGAARGFAAGGAPDDAARRRIAEGLDQSGQFGPPSSMKQTGKTAAQEPARNLVGGSAPDDAASVPFSQLGQPEPTGNEGSVWKALMKNSDVEAMKARKLVEGVGSRIGAVPENATPLPDYRGASAPQMTMNPEARALSALLRDAPPPKAAKPAQPAPQAAAPGPAAKGNAPASAPAKSNTFNMSAPASAASDPVADRMAMMRGADAIRAQRLQEQAALAELAAARTAYDAPAGVAAGHRGNAERYRAQYGRAMDALAGGAAQQEQALKNQALKLEVGGRQRAEDLEAKKASALAVLLGDGKDKAEIERARKTLETLNGSPEKEAERRAAIVGELGKAYIAAAGKHDKINPMPGFDEYMRQIMPAVEGRGGGPAGLTFAGYSPKGQKVWRNEKGDLLEGDPE